MKTLIGLQDVCARYRNKLLTFLVLVSFYLKYPSHLNSSLLSFSQLFSFLLNSSQLLLMFLCSSQLCSFILSYSQRFLSLLLFSAVLKSFPPSSNNAQKKLCFFSRDPHPEIIILLEFLIYRLEIISFIYFDSLFDIYLVYIYINNLFNILYDIYIYTFLDKYIIIFYMLFDMFSDSYSIFIFKIFSYVWLMWGNIYWNLVLIIEKKLK
jgi:hypothetical protein